MIKQIIEKLGCDSDQYKEQIKNNEKHLAYTGRMWDPIDDIVIDILYEKYHDDINSAYQVIDMLEEQFGDTIYLYYALRFRYQK